MFKNILLLAQFFIPVLCFSVTYYVSPSGNNGNNGLTSSTAFLTLQHASNTVSAGDSVIVMAGTYTGFYHTTSGTALQRIIFSAQAGVLINAPNGTTNDGINLEGADYVTVEGFKVYGVPRAGLRAVLNQGVIFRNNVADSCGKWGILTGFSENILIENNECSRSRDEHGIYFSNSADNPVIRGNHCWGNNACGIHMNGDVSLPPGDGIISNALVELNIIHDNGNGGGSGINGDGVQNSRIQNNLLYNNHSSGISLYRIDGGGSATNNVVVNNTIVQPTVTRWALNISDTSTGNTAFNNIFYSDHSFRGSISVDATSMAGFKSDYNILTNRMTSDGNNNSTLAQWQQATQLDSHSVIATPAQLFANAGANDYHLSPASPAKDAGTASYQSLAAPPEDLAHQPRPQGVAHDAGAYELLVFTALREILNAPLMWNDVSPDSEVWLFDTGGRLLFNGTKQAADSRLMWMESGLFIFKTAGKDNKTYSGWVRNLKY